MPHRRDCQAIRIFFVRGKDGGSSIEQWAQLSSNAVDGRPIALDRLARTVRALDLITSIEDSRATLVLTRLEHKTVAPAGALVQGHAYGLPAQRAATPARSASR